MRISTKCVEDVFRERALMRGRLGVTCRVRTPGCGMKPNAGQGKKCFPVGFLFGKKMKSFECC